MTTTTATQQQPVTVTPAALDELERLAQAATPGPWRVEYDNDYDEFSGASYRWIDSIQAKHGAILGAFDNPPTEEDADFIAAACNLALPLVAQLRAEKAAREVAMKEAEMMRTALDETTKAVRGALDLCEQAERERDEARQRVERAEAEREELREFLDGLQFDYGQSWAVYDYEAARALLARMDAERKDGGE